MIHVGFTGTRHGMTFQQIHNVRVLLVCLKQWRTDRTESATLTCHHGDCVGADAKFHEIARAMGGTRLVGHLPVDESHRAFCMFDEAREPLTHMKRNREIVRASQFMIATPFEAVEQERGGTWATIRMARKAKVPIAVVTPAGPLLDSWPAELGIPSETMIGERINDGLVFLPPVMTAEEAKNGLDQLRRDEGDE